MQLKAIDGLLSPYTSSTLSQSHRLDVLKPAARLIDAYQVRLARNTTVPRGCSHLGCCGEFKFFNSPLSRPLERPLDISNRQFHHGQIHTSLLFSRSLTTVAKPQHSFPLKATRLIEPVLLSRWISYSKSPTPSFLIICTLGFCRRAKLPSDTRTTSRQTPRRSSQHGSTRLQQHGSALSLVQRHTAAC